MNRFVSTLICLALIAAPGGCTTPRGDAKSTGKPLEVKVPEGETLLGSSPAPAEVRVPSTAPQAATAAPDQLLPTATSEGVIPAAPAAGDSGYPVVRRGASGRYVLIKAPRGLPQGATLVVLRDGKPVGSVRVSGPRQPGWLSADIVEGDVKAGDIARP